jgi:uncharacterized membrane protein YfcA
MTVGDWAGMAAASFFAAVLLATNGFGFAVLAVPFFLMFAPAGQAIQIIIILTVTVSLVVALRLRQALDRPLLVRLSVGSLIGLPLGLVAFRVADPLIVRAVAGATVVAFAVMLAQSRLRPRPASPLRMAPRWDLAAGTLAGAANALVGMAGPLVLIYLMLAGAPIRTVRATLVAFFALIYAATLAADVLFLGVSSSDWLIAASLLPPIGAGSLIGLGIGNRLGAAAAEVLVIAVLGGAGLYTLAAAAQLAP